MFKKNTLVAWTTRKGSKGNTYMGRVISSDKNRSVVKVTSTAKRSRDIGKSFSIANVCLGDISTGKTEVIRAA